MTHDSHEKSNDSFRKIADSHRKSIGGQSNLFDCCKKRIISKKNKISPLNWYKTLIEFPGNKSIEVVWNWNRFGTMLFYKSPHRSDCSPVDCFSLNILFFVILLDFRHNELTAYKYGDGFDLVDGQQRFTVLMLMEIVFGWTDFLRVGINTRLSFFADYSHCMPYWLEVRLIVFDFLVKLQSTYNKKWHRMIFYRTMNY